MDKIFLQDFLREVNLSSNKLLEKLMEESSKKPLLFHQFLNNLPVSVGENELIEGAYRYFNSNKMTISDDVLLYKKIESKLTKFGRMEIKLINEGNPLTEGLFSSEYAKVDDFWKELIMLVRKNMARGSKKNGELCDRVIKKLDEHQDIIEKSSKNPSKPYVNFYLHMFDLDFLDGPVVVNILERLKLRSEVILNNISDTSSSTSYNLIANIYKDKEAVVFRYLNKIGFFASHDFMVAKNKSLVTDITKALNNNLDKDGTVGFFKTLNVIEIMLTEGSKELVEILTNIGFGVNKIKENNNDASSARVLIDKINAIDKGLDMRLESHHLYIDIKNSKSNADVLYMLFFSKGNLPNTYSFIENRMRSLEEGYLYTKEYKIMNADMNGGYDKSIPNTKFKM